MGVDVGQKRDPSALVLVERSERATGVVSPVTYEHAWEVRQVVRLAEALPLEIGRASCRERV